MFLVVLKNVHSDYLILPISYRPDSELDVAYCLELTISHQLLLDYSKV